MTWTEAEAEFAKNFERYAPRPSQTALGLTAEDALSRGVSLLAQAPCGVGKSFVAQVAAVDHSFATGLPVVLSTATKALQDQYIRDAEALTKLYKPFVFARLKGRGNYLCLQKLSEGPELSVGVQAVRDAVKDPEADGDLDTFPVPLTAGDRFALSTSSDECPGKKECPFGEVCLAEKAKSKAADAQVVIANHALVVLDAALKDASDAGGGLILPEYSAIVFDEAHELEEYATTILGQEITERSIRNVVVDACAFTDDMAMRDKLIGQVGKLFAELGKALPDPRTKTNTATLTPELVVEIGAPLTDVVAGLKALWRAVNVVYVHGDDQKASKRKRLLKRVSGTGTKLVNVITAEFSDLVRWIERETKTDKTGSTFTQINLKYAPISVAEDLKRTIWDKVPAVLMSATLSVGNDFGYLKDRLGLPDAESFDCPSPFDFERQARMYIPVEGESKVSGMLRLLKAADGRALMLFTSWRELNAAYATLAPEIKNMGHRVLKQGEMGTRALAQAFADDEHSVLFGVKSFGTGIDIQGDSLRFLSIDSLPFKNPSDVVYTARCELIDQAATGWNDKAFMKMSVPAMTLDLAQWVGRLIRSMDDQGLVAVWDWRMGPVKGKSYGGKVRKAMPPMPVLTKVEDAEEYLWSLDGDREPAPALVDFS